MLGKLIKYEVRATSRLFLPFYGALIILALINKTFFSFKTPIPDFIAEVTLGIYGVIMIAIAVLTFLVMIQRFYKNLLTDEGYLMFTLPVRPWQLITSKLIAAIIWMALSAFVALFTIFLMVFNSQMLPHLYKFIIEFFQKVSPTDRMAGILFVFRLGLTTFISGVCTILMIYASIAIGHLFGKYRILASFGAFLAITFLLQGVGSLSTAFFMRPLVERLDQAQAFFEFANAIGTLLWASNLINIVLSVVFFSLTSYILQKRLNLE